jgi:hypothetical protein
MDSVTIGDWFGNRHCFANPSKVGKFHKPRQQRFDNAGVLRCDRVTGGGELIQFRGLSGRHHGNRLVVFIPPDYDGGERR